jgi:hypothetical protein
MRIMSDAGSFFALALARGIAGGWDDFSDSIPSTSVLYAFSRFSPDPLFLAVSLFSALLNMS